MEEFGAEEGHCLRQSGASIFNGYRTVCAEGRNPVGPASAGQAALFDERQVENIVKKVIAQFRARTGTNPTRVVIHKSSMFQPEETDGFWSGCGSSIPFCDMIWMLPSGFRLIRKGKNEVERGMLASVEDQKLYLFTTGYVD